ncbi:hypothetical protein GCM10007935_14800 [Hydrogenophaga electricum]|uniref:DUF2239 family protein n=2 Tax=Comamonadaceae TaxID=80864 RepID=A0ABQ6C5K0_9BURK|nr:hypothetical protein GCM10007935_14800 [Hydrogenophaga electricum]
MRAMLTETPDTPAEPWPTCSAFLGPRRVAQGRYADVARALADLPASDERLLVFDDGTGAQVDHPWPAGTGEPEDAAADGAAPDSGASVGRPRLGVVAREVTLLPRHWAWLAQQRGGASATLRRLVDEARRSQVQADAQRLARERAYRFMSAMTADWPGFEEACRALFAGDGAGFHRQTTGWPADVKGHLAWLARDAFDVAP